MRTEVTDMVKNRRGRSAFSGKRIQKRIVKKGSLQRKLGPSDPMDGLKRYLGKASLTVESAAVLPLFFLALLMLVGILDIFRAQAQVTVSLDSSIRELGMYAYSAQGQEGFEAGISAAACGAYARSQLVLPENCRNLQVVENSWDGQKIRLRVRYEYRLPVTFFPIPGIILENSAQVHAWVGYQGEFSGDSQEEKGEEMVFVTRNGSVYHTHGDCTYLQLTVYQTTPEEAQKRKNEQGARYRACEKCGGQGETVYLSPQGEAYHSSRECSGLSRYVEMVNKTTCSGIPECSRCAGRE